MCVQIAERGYHALHETLIIDDVRCKQVAWRNAKFTSILCFAYISVRQTCKNDELDNVINRLSHRLDHYQPSS